MQFRDICAQSRKLSLNVLNFARFLHSQILRGWCPLKVVPALSPPSSSTSRGKVYEATPFGSKDPSSNTLHFKAIFDSPLKKVCKGAAVPDGRCASKTWSFSSACKNLVAQHPLGAEICSSEKCAFGGYNSTSRSPRSLDQTSPDLFRLTQEESR